MLDYNTITLIEAIYITLDSGYVNNFVANEIREYIYIYIYIYIILKNVFI